MQDDRNRAPRGTSGEFGFQQARRIVPQAGLPCPPHVVIGQEDLLLLRPPSVHRVVEQPEAKHVAWAVVDD